MATENHPYLTLKGLENQLELTKKEIKAGGYLPGGIWFKDTKTIVCGTFPPRTEYEDKKGKKRKGYLHYSSNRNEFWRHFDAIFGETLYQKLYEDGERIKSAIDKIKVIKSKKIGFIDIFTKVQRKPTKRQNAKDSNLIPVETIFDNGTFKKTLKNSVYNYIFVYSLARNSFKTELKKAFIDVKCQVVQERTADNIPEVIKATINEKTIYFTYAPIHGRRIPPKRRQDALKDAFKRIIRNRSRNPNPCP